MPPEIFAIPTFLTPLTATLVHIGPLHLTLNMVLLLVVGRLTEMALGPRLTILLYVVGAYAAALAQWLPDPGSVTPMAGASGAVSALIGASAMLFGRSRARAIGPIPEPVVRGVWLTAAWAAVNWGIAVALGGPDFQLAWMAHIGGFIAGVALAPFLLLWRMKRPA
jgi:membrane associated rhomboid family serine protease